MSKDRDMLGQVVRALVGVKTNHHGLLLDIINKLGGDRADAIHTSLTTALRASTTAVVTSPVTLSQPIRVPYIFGAVANFVVADEFVLGTENDFPISYMGDNFQRQLLPLVESKVPATTLRERKLLEMSVDTLIIKKLGGQNKARSHMAHVKQFLKMADRLQWYLFYIEDCFGVLCTLRVDWRAGGWNLRVYPVSYPDQCYVGSVVVAS